MARTAATTPGFKFATPEDAGAQPRTVLGAQAADLMMVNYIDGEGKKQNRLAAVFPGSKGGVKAFLFNEKISGQWVATEAYSWLNKALGDVLHQEKTGGVVASV